jgi:hypothetical protein
LAAEAQANLLQDFELSVIPGLLQTPDYARAVLQYNRHAPIDIEERVRRRIKRQAILTDDNPPMCIFVIDEYALHRMVGGKEVMLEQLTRLRDLASQPNIVIKIVPSNTEYYAGCPFMVARMDSIEIVNLDDALSGRVIKERGKVVEIVKIWEEIREAALSSKESLQLIEKVMEKWTP